jgi:hypothetical protein
MNAYLVLKQREGSASVESQGIFSTLEKAKAACKTAEDIVMTHALDQELPQDRVFCCDCYHPLSGTVMRAGTTEWVPA